MIKPLLPEALLWHVGRCPKRRSHCHGAIVICLHWTTKPWTFQVRENHVVERMSKYIQYIYMCILLCGKPNNKSPDYHYKWIKQVSPAMVYIGLRHWVYHWIHRRFGTPPEPVGMWSCSPALQQHSHWSHGSSLRMLIFHESECVYHAQRIHGAGIFTYIDPYLVI